jgi:hypothetical protein
MIISGLTVTEDALHNASPKPVHFCTCVTTLRILIASLGTIHWAVQRPRAATTGLHPKTVLSVKRPQQFLRF